MEQPTRRQKNPSMMRTIAKTVLHITLPPVAGRYHGRYRGKPHHLTIDTLLAIGMFVLLGWNILLTFSRAVPVSAITVDITAPKETVSGTGVEYVITVANPAKPAGYDVVLELTYPAGFHFTESLPAAADAQHSTWYLGRVNGRASAQVTVRGTLYGSPDSRVPLRAVLRYAEQHYSLTDTAFGWVQIQRLPNVSLTLAAPQSVAAHQPFPITITVRNAGNSDFAKLAVVVAEEESITLGNATPPFSRTNTWHIERLPAGATQTFMAVATLAEQKDNAFHLSFYVGQRLDDAVYGQASDSQRMTVFPSSAASAKIAAPILARVAHYWNTAGIQFGFGPLPPTVGERTGYRLFWTVTAGASSIRQGTVQATLPVVSEWNGNVAVTAGEPLRYSAETRTVSWKLGAVAAEMTTSASFDVVVKPQASDIGTNLLLLNPSSMTATLEDGTTVSARAPAMRNVLTDPGATDSGRVEQ